MPAPFNTPTISKPTPIVLDELLVETTDSNKALYDRMLEVGHYHPNQQLYPGYQLLKIQPTQYGTIQYTWANGFTAQDSYNATKEYAEDANAFPTFIRSYRVLRSGYLVTGPLTKLTAFTGIVSVSITNGGTGYTHDFAVTFTGGGGSGGSAWAIVNRGVIVRVEINNVGTGYTSVPTVVFSAGDGASAAATAIIQPTTCLLVSEKHGKLPDDDPYSSLYDKVTRVWMTLPGPIISGVRYDDETGLLIPVSKQVVQAGTGGTSLQTDGSYATVTPTTSVLSLKETDSVVNPSGFSRTYGVSRRVALPRVLTTFTPTVYNDTDGNIISANVFTQYTDYSGNYAITVFEDWKSTPFSGLTSAALITQGFQWSVPFGSGDVVESLHPALTITASSSAGLVPAGYGRFYDSFNITQTSLSTTPTSLSGSTIVLKDEQTHYKGGYLRYKESITIP